MKNKILLMAVAAVFSINASANNPAQENEKLVTIDKNASYQERIEALKKATAPKKQEKDDLLTWDEPKPTGKMSLADKCANNNNDGDECAGFRLWE